jgi:tripartite-type tricarboxylate transporter receptor subunit TctC
LAIPYHSEKETGRSEWFSADVPSSAHCRSSSFQLWIKAPPRPSNGLADKSTSSFLPPPARLSDHFRQQFVIDNRPAAGGTLAEQDLSRSAPDGYTIGLLSTSTHVIAKLYNPDLPYDEIKDFAPISLLGSSPYVLAVYTGLPVRDVAELVALAKRKQPPLSNAAFGTMSLGYLASVLFAQKSGIKLNQIPYRSSAQAVVDVVAGRVDMQFSTLPPAVPLIREGKLRALATTGPQRFPTLPDVPTLAESGLADFDVALWLGIAAPAGTSPSIVARLNSELAAILTAPDMRDALMRQSFVAEPSSPDALSRRISADLEKWREVVSTAASVTP